MTTCDPKTGSCVFAPSTGNACSDGKSCTLGDTCQLGVCTPTKLIPCDDGNVCTDDLCDAAGTCSHKNNSLACDDGNACTAGDKCALGKCTGGAAVLCNDGCSCTADACNPKTGCAAAFATGSSCLGTDNKVHMCDVTTFKTVCVGCAKVP